MNKKLFLSVASIAIAAAVCIGCGLPNNPDSGNDNGQTQQINPIDVISSIEKKDVDPLPIQKQGIDDEDINIELSEASSIKYVDKSTSEGYFNLKVPEGWYVEEYTMDVLGYILIIYDPEVPSRRVTFCCSTASYKSQDAIDIAKRYTNEDLSRCAINPDGTTSSYFKNSVGTLNFYGYSDYSEIADLGENGYGGNIMQGSAKYKDGTAVEGLFSVSSFQALPHMDYLGTDITPWLDEGLVIMTAPEEEFPTWEPVLTEIFGNIQMTDAYLDARARAWGQIQRESAAIAEMANQMSDIIMSGWESRNNTYDILSQEYSDATLGRDRVYDTDTGEVYYTDNGWIDSYNGSRYELVESGSSYFNLPVTGTIY